MKTGCTAKPAAKKLRLIQQRGANAPITMSTTKPAKASQSHPKKWKSVFDDSDVLAARTCLHQIVPRPKYSRRELLELIRPDIAAALDRGVQVDQVQSALEPVAIKVSSSLVYALNRPTTGKAELEQNNFEERDRF